MEQMNRRAFLGRTVGLVAASAVGGCRSWRWLEEDGFSINGIRIGVQMWSVDKLWKQDPAEAFRRLKAMGYDGVQSFGFYAMDWNELEKMLDGEGLRIVDMPFYMKNVAPGEFEKFVEFCKRFDVDFVYEPFAKYKTGPEWAKHADELLEVRARFAVCGIRMGYHNHQHELKERFDGQAPLQILNERNLDFELDVGHVKLAGGDPVKLLERLQGRVPSIHAKPGGGNALGDAADANDWRAIFNAAAAAGTRWAIVECETRRDTFEDVERSMAYLKSLVQVDVAPVKSTVDIDSWEFKRRAGSLGGAPY